jgi:hypothetical protein
MEPTRSRSPSPPSRPENIQFVHLLSERNQAERDGSLEEKTRANKDLVEFVELGLLDGTSRAIADMFCRICKKSIVKHTAALNKPSSVSAASASNTRPPCPAFGR